MVSTLNSVDLDQKTQRLIVERYRCCRHDLADFATARHPPQDKGYFSFGSDVICYGECGSGTPTISVSRPLHDVSSGVVINGETVTLPFDPGQVVDDLRFERYLSKPGGEKEVLPANDIVRSIYYGLRPAFPVAVRKYLQRLYFRVRSQSAFPTWPVDRTVENLLERLLVLSMKARKVRKVPFIWFWPDGAPSAVIITHDVETAAGLTGCSQLMDVNESFGIKSSFQIVPEDRYSLPEALLGSIRERGFELNVHDLNHDGRLFFDRGEFLARAERINRYVRQFGALGFRSAVLYRNAEWLDSLDVSYDMSIPNVAHLDPQAGGCCTVLPFFVGKVLELPVTTTQDYSLFHVLNDYSIRLWEKQISLIKEKNGLISFIIHPDYLNTETARRVYSDLLRYLSKIRAQRETWIALPREVAAWWRLRSELNLIKVRDSWRIEGEGRERARIAYAVLENDDTLTYSFDRE